MTEQDFVAINEAGFGDHWNTYAWSMQWWRGRLYVGTNRAFPCVEYYLLHTHWPRIQRYPPRFDPDVSCTECVYDLPLQAEIWRYTPETLSWDRVYQAPADVEVPGHAGTFVPHEIGFRNMILFTEPDGTEALYVAGVSARPLNPSLPPPRLLRSTDGETFAPLPAAPGTALGELDGMGFRALAVYKERLFAAAGGLYGAGAVYEARDPARGDDCFRQAGPSEMRVNEMAAFNGFLYLGLRHPTKGYAVVKTDASGTPPYAYQVVVPFGAYRKDWPCNSVVSMCVFEGLLYVGTGAPTELIRIYPDDSWDLVVGKPRRTPQGMKYPLSGLGDGFGDVMNRVVQRMHVHGGWLYVGTLNGAGKQLSIPVLGRWMQRRIGFDLYATRDGIHFVTITRNGLGDRGDAVRTMVSTPMGLFLGAIEEHHGARVYWGREAGERHGERLSAPGVSAGQHKSAHPPAR